MASSASTVNCSICLEELSDTCNRTIVTLRCSHMFHLDCIGSAFNAARIMQCPNCREVENGEWLCFEYGIPERIMDERAYNEAVRFHHHHHYMPPCNEYFCPVHGRVRELPFVGYQDVSQRLALLSGNPNFNDYRYGPYMDGENAALNVIHHPYHGNCHFTFNSMSTAHDSGASQMPFPAIPLLNVRMDPITRPNLESVAERVIFDPGQISYPAIPPLHVGVNPIIVPRFESTAGQVIHAPGHISHPTIAPLTVRRDPITVPRLELVDERVVLDPGLGSRSSVGSLIGSGSLGSNCPSYNNFRMMQPYSSSQIATVQNTLGGRYEIPAANRGSPPEQTGMFDIRPSIHAPIHTPSQPAICVHQHIWEGNDITHPEYLEDNMDPFGEQYE